MGGQVSAATGVIVAAFVLFQYFGHIGANFVAVTLNIFVAYIAWLLSQKEYKNSYALTGSTKIDLDGAQKNRRSNTHIVIFAAYTLSGFLYIGYELVWMRFFLMFFRDSIYLYAVSIAAVITGAALGTFLVGILADRVKSNTSLLAWLFIASAALNQGFLMILVYLHRPVVIITAGKPAVEALIIFFSIAVPFVVTGSGFALVTRVLNSTYKSSGSGAGRAYCLNTLGGVAAAIAIPFFLIPAIGLDGIVVLFVFLSCLCSIGLWFFSPEKKYLLPKRSLRALAALVLIVPLLFNPGLVQGILVQFKGSGKLLEVRQSVLGTNWAIEQSRSKRVVLYENLVAFSKGGSNSFIVQGFIPLMLASETPQTILGLCFGGGLTYHATKFFPEIECLDMVDISRTNVKMAMELLDINTSLAEDPRVKFHIDDAYSYVKYSKSSYDLILIDSNPPFYSHKCTTLYSAEFYSYCRELLNDGGFFTQVLPIKQMTAEEVKSVMGTFAQSFPHVALWWNALDPLMIASNQPFAFDIDIMAERFSRPDIEQALEKYSGPAKYGSLGHFLAGLLMDDTMFRAFADGSKINTVNKNYLEYSTEIRVDNTIIPEMKKMLTEPAVFANMFTNPDLILEYQQEIAARRNYLIGLSERDMLASRIRF